MVRNGFLLVLLRFCLSEKKFKDFYSGVVNEFSFGVSNRFYGDSVNKVFEKVDSGRWSEELSVFGIDLVVFILLKFLELVFWFLKFIFWKVFCFLVLFEWEEEFGKFKFEEKVVFDVILKL